MQTVQDLIKELKKFPPKSIPLIWDQGVKDSFEVKDVGDYSGRPILYYNYPDDENEKD